MHLDSIKIESFSHHRVRGVPFPFNPIPNVLAHGTSLAQCAPSWKNCPLRPAHHHLSPQNKILGTPLKNEFRKYFRPKFKRAFK